MATPPLFDREWVAALQAQLVFEVNQLRGAVLLGRPDHGRILCVRGGPHKAIGNPTDLGAAESPANSAKHQAWVQVSP